DESGRPRSTRPRDALGRPLRQGSEGVARIPDDLALPPAETLAYAQDLLDRGLAFNAHEVLEAAWKNGPDDERMLWQGLAQLAVGITHIQRGNVKGAITVPPRVGPTCPGRPTGALRHRRRPFGRLRRCADRRPRGGRRDHTEASATPSGCRPTPIAWGCCGHVELRNCSSRTVPNASTWCGGGVGCRAGSRGIRRRWPHPGVGGSTS